MKSELIRSDMIVLASAQTPGLISPQWMKETQLISEEPKQFVNTPDFSFFDSESYSLMIDHRRLHITTKKQDRNSLKSLARIGSGYITLLPHISYIALGLNFVWLGKKDEDEEDDENPPRVEINIGSIDIPKIFPTHELHYGGIIFAEKDPYVLKLTIEPQKETAFIYNFNYHHDVKGLHADKIKGYIDNFVGLHEDSQKIMNLLSKGGKKND